MDGCPRQDPAYRPAKGRPRYGGAFLCVGKPVTRHGSLREVQRRSLAVKPKEEKKAILNAVEKLEAHGEQLVPLRLTIRTGTPARRSWLLRGSRRRYVGWPHDIAGTCRSPAGGARGMRCRRVPVAGRGVAARTPAVLGRTSPRRSGEGEVAFSCVRSRNVFGKRWFISNQGPLQRCAGRLPSTGPSTDESGATGRC